MLRHICVGVHKHGLQTPRRLTWLHPCCNIPGVRTASSVQHVNCLVSDYTKRGKGREALRAYAEMREDGIIPNNHTFAIALKACSSVGDLESGKEIHAHVKGSTVQMDVFVANTLLDMYAKCWSMQDAQNVFETMGQHDVVCWTTMIAGYARMEMGELALQLYMDMQNEGFVPNSHTFVAALKACHSLVAKSGGKEADGRLPTLRSLEQGKVIHAEISKRGLESSVYVANTLVDMYTKCGSIKDARWVFEQMPEHNVVSWNAMIRGYAEVEMGGLALDLYTQMQHEGFLPNGRTFVAALNACGSLAGQAGKTVDGGLLKSRCLEQGRAIHTEVVNGGLESDVFVANTLIDTYAKCGSMLDARHVFERMVHRSVVSWTIMITGYAQMGMGALALESYAQMKCGGLTPNDRTFVAALKACGSLAEEEESQMIGGELLKPWCLQQVRAIHLQAARSGFEPDIFVASTLVDTYAKCGSMTEARQVFEKRAHRSCVSWNAVIMGYAQAGTGGLALEMFACMRHEGFLPDDCTFFGVLKACSSLASLEIGREIHAQLDEAGRGSEFLLVSCVIDMFGKCGSMIDAQLLFNSLHVKDSVTWGTLMAGYSSQGDCEHVFDLYKRMQQEGVEPDGIAFVSVITACSHNGLVGEGQEYFQTMCLQYGISPSSKHYMSMVNLLGRAGRLDEAVAMVEKMSVRPDIAMWMTVAGACRKWGCVEVGRSAFECAAMLGQKRTAAYALTTSIHAFLQMSGGE